MVLAIMAENFYTPICNAKAVGILSQNKILKSLVQRLKQEPEAVLNEFVTLQKYLHRSPTALRCYHVIGDIYSLPNPLAPFFDQTIPTPSTPKVGSSSSSSYNIIQDYELSFNSFLSFYLIV
jgi:hypothetical protein